MNWLKKHTLQISAVQSYGTNSHFYVLQGALDDALIHLRANTTLQLIVNSWRRFETDEIKIIGLDLKLPNDKIIKPTDAKGFYKVDENTYCR